MYWNVWNTKVDKDLIQCLQILDGGVSVSLEEQQVQTKAIDYCK